MYDRVAAARYWSDERLDGIAPGEHDAEDMAVLCLNKPRAIAYGYALWETACLEEMVPDLTEAIVVDLGCGVGRLLPNLASRSRRTYGFDLAPGMVERASRRIADYPNARAAVGGVDEVDLPDSSADVVICVGVFEHLPIQLRTRALAEIRRILVPGGRLVLELNNVDSVLLGQASTDNPHRRGEQLPNGYFCDLMSVDETLNQAADTGLKVLHVRLNAFYSLLRHAHRPGGELDAIEVFTTAARLDRRADDCDAIRMVADQAMVLMERT